LSVAKYGVGKGPAGALEEGEKAAEAALKRIWASLTSRKGDFSPETRNLKLETFDLRLGT
jgi:hypothetical protein